MFVLQFDLLNIIYIACTYLYQQSMVGIGLHLINICLTKQTSYNTY